MNRKLIVANWKMNPATSAEAKKLFTAYYQIKPARHIELVACPPFPFLSLVDKSRLSLGAQDIFPEPQGAFTGEVSASMLISLGVKSVIVGHSERRKWQGETDELISEKVLTAFRSGLRPILCVGEPKEIRAKGLNAVQAFVKKQLSIGLRNIPGPNRKKVVIAYEPIWAISGGDPKKQADKPETALEVIRFIKSFTPSQVLYGGSVNSLNAAAFVGQAEIDGALVGGASLKGEEFKKLVKSC